MNAKSFIARIFLGCFFTLGRIDAVDTSNFDLRIESSVEVSFQADTGKIYQIESSPDIPSPAWTTDGQMIEGVGQRYLTNFLTGLAGKRIFRIVELSLTNGLIADYPFDGNANDVSPNNNNATVFGAQLTTNRFGVEQSAFEFNGTSDYISAPHQDYLNFPNDGDFTISLWALLENPEIGGVFINKDNGGGDFPKWMFVAGGVPNQEPGMRIHFHINGPPQWFATPLYTPPADRWQHYVVRKAGSDYSIFINGDLISTSVSTNLISSQITAPLVIGKAGEGGGYLKGQIDDIRIWNRPLLSGELQLLEASAD